MKSESNRKWKLVGKVKEAHGLRGELYVILFAKENSWLDDLTQFSLALDESSAGKQVFSAGKLRSQKNTMIIKSEEIIDRTAAEKLCGSLFFIPAELLASKPGDRIYLSEILNFEVYDGDQLIGKITSFSSNGPQDLLIVSGGGTIEIPFVEAFIDQIDFSNQKVMMKLPEGLLQINRENSAKGKGEP
jgi:16S rRNA processing protein RimM